MVTHIVSTYITIHDVTFLGGRCVQVADESARRVEAIVIVKQLHHRRRTDFTLVFRFRNTQLPVVITSGEILLLAWRTVFYCHLHSSVAVGGKLGQTRAVLVFVFMRSSTTEDARPQEATVLALDDMKEEDEEALK